MSDYAAKWRRAHPDDDLPESFATVRAENVNELKAIVGGLLDALGDHAGDHMPSDTASPLCRECWIPFADCAVERARQAVGR